ncbi:MAG: hypothetical protein QXI22_02130 [Sulfolobales archaeon]
MLLSAVSSYMLNEKEPFEQVLPIYIEFKGMYALYHGRKEEVLAILAGLLGGPKHWLIRDLEDLHLIAEDSFKDFIDAYVLGGSGEALASGAAIYHEAVEDLIEHEERVILPKMLDILVKTGIGEQTISQVFRGIETNLGEGFYERMLGLVDDMEKRLSSALMKSGATAMNITGLKPYEKRAQIKKKIREIKNRNIYKLILINSRDPTPLYYKLLNTEQCIDQNLFRSKQLSNRTWVSMIVLREECR